MWAAEESLVSTVSAESAIQRFHWDLHIVVILCVVDIMRMAKQEWNCILSWLLLWRSDPRHAENRKSHCCQLGSGVGLDFIKTKLDHRRARRRAIQAALEKPACSFPS